MIGQAASEAGELPDPDPRINLIGSNIVEQFHGVDDITAAKMVELAARAIVNGQANVGSGSLAFWKTAIEDTVKHYQEGRHQAL